MYRLLIGIVALSLSLAAEAQIKLGTGSCPTANGKGGATYCALALDMQRVCAPKVALSVQPSKGSVENIQRILDNEYAAGIVQFDVMRYFEEKDEGMARVRVLLPLHLEEIHIIALNKGYKSGGVIDIFKKSVELETLKDLAGRKVVAWGGSVLSAEYFAFKLKLGYEVVDITDKDHPEQVAAKMLAEGEAHAIFAVGGQPIGWLREEKVYGKQFKLLAINSDIGDQVKGTYNPVRLNYLNLSHGQVPSLGVQALLVTREFRTEDRAKALTALRQCIIENADSFRDLGMHPKWQSIDVAAKFDRWANYVPPQPHPKASAVDPVGPDAAAKSPPRKKPQVSVDKAPRSDTVGWELRSRSLSSGPAASVE